MTPGRLPQRPAAMGRRPMGGNGGPWLVRAHRAPVLVFRRPIGPAPTPARAPAPRAPGRAEPVHLTLRFLVRMQLAERLRTVVHRGPPPPARTVTGAAGARGIAGAGRVAPPLREWFTWLTGTTAAAGATGPFRGRPPSRMFRSPRTINRFRAPGVAIRRSGLRRTVRLPRTSAAAVLWPRNGRGPVAGRRFAPPAASRLVRSFSPPDAPPRPATTTTTTIQRLAPAVHRRLAGPAGRPDPARRPADPRTPMTAAGPYVWPQPASAPPAVRDRMPVARVHRAAPAVAPPAVITPARRPPEPATGPEPGRSPADLDALGRDLWRRFERQVRIEQERRGRR